MPEGTRRPDRVNHRPAAIVAAVALVMGMLLLGTLTSPPDQTSDQRAGPTGEPVDPSTFQVSDIATGPQLIWRRSEGIGGGTPVDLLNHDGLFYLFTSEADLWDREASWSVSVSADALVWERFEEVLTMNTPSRIVSTDRGLLTAASADGGFEVWGSEDGVRWDAQLVPVEELPDYVSANPHAVAATGREIALAANYEVDLGSILEGALGSPEIALAMRRFGWGVESVAGEPESLLVYGPLGLELASVPLDELGLDEEQRTWLEEGYAARPDARVWYFHEELGWQESFIDTEWVDTLAFDGAELLAFGWGQTPLEQWSTYDGGATWEKTGSPPLSSWTVTPFQGRLLAVAQSGRVDLVARGDDGQWSSLGLAELFPPQMGWQPSFLSAGPAGVAFIAESWRFDGEWTTRFEPVTLVEGGARLAIDLAQGLLRLDTADGTWAWPMNRGAEGVEIDLVNDLVAFHDPETGEPLAAFSLEEVAEAEELFWGQEPAPDLMQALVWSRDLEEWSIQDITAQIGEGWVVSDLAVGPERVAIFAHLPDHPRERADEGFRVWSAPLP